MSAGEVGSVRLADVLRHARNDFLAHWLTLAGLGVLFKFVVAWMFAPAIAWLLSAVLARSGNLAVSNQDIAGFLLTPTGLVYAVLFASTTLALLLLAQAGTMVIVATNNGCEISSSKRLLSVLATRIVRIVQLGAAQVILVGLSLSPLVLLAFLACGVFLTEHDINYYLADRPLEFYLAAGLVCVLAVVGVGVGLWLYVRWSLALPILLFEEQQSMSSLKASRDRVRGAGWRVAGILLGWQIVWLLVGLGLAAGFRVFAGEVLRVAGERSTTLIPLLALRAVLLAIISFVAIVGQALLTRRLYLARSPEAVAEIDPGSPVLPPGRRRRLFFWTVAVLVMIPLLLWGSVPRSLRQARVQITAHRGASLVAPENTLSAVRLAIEQGADYAEIDVQETADGEIVLLHDNDLMRVGGLARSVGQMTFAEIRKLDVGSQFSSAFAGEKIPTLQEVIELARGKIKLNIELKFAGRDRRLAKSVADLLRAEQFENECVVTSLTYDGLVALKAHHPGLRTGLIVAQALGDITQLQVDALSVRARALSEEGLRAARRQGKEVHVWTVNDPRRMAQEIQRGVDNIITDDPETLVGVRAEWEALTPPEQFLLASRSLLGLGN